MKILLLSLLLILSLDIYAFSCEDQEQLKTLLIQSDHDLKNGYIGDCRKDPTEANRLLVAWRQSVNDSQDDEPSAQRINILTVDQLSGKIKRKYLDPHIYESDALNLGSIQFDLAAYQLNPKLRAVGLRVFYHGMSRANPWDYTLLNLYDLENHKKLLDRLLVNELQGENDGRCNSEYQVQRSTVAVLPLKKNQIYSDLNVQSKLSVEGAKGDENQCDDYEKNQGKRMHRLIFDGTQYVIPKVLQDFRNE